jgi:hypothetical protein
LVLILLKMKLEQVSWGGAWSFWEIKLKHFNNFFFHVFLHQVGTWCNRIPISESKVKFKQEIYWKSDQIFQHALVFCQVHFFGMTFLRYFTRVM